MSFTTTHSKSRVWDTVSCSGCILRCFRTLVSTRGRVAREFQWETGERSRGSQGGPALGTGLFSHRMRSIARVVEPNCSLFRMLAEGLHGVQVRSCRRSPGIGRVVWSVMSCHKILHESVLFSLVVTAVQVMVANVRPLSCHLKLLQGLPAPPALGQLHSLRTVW